jgi:hypothetical protein
MFSFFLKFFIKMIVLAAWQRAFKKLAALHCPGRKRVQKLHATDSQSHSNCTRVAASHMQHE